VAATPTPITWRESTMTPAQSAARAREIVATMTGNAKHRSFDELINQIAREAGHGEAVSIFEKHAASCHNEGNGKMHTLYLCGPINGCTAYFSRTCMR